MPLEGQEGGGTRVLGCMATSGGNQGTGLHGPQWGEPGYWVAWTPVGGTRVLGYMATSGGGGTGFGVRR